MPRSHRNPPGWADRRRTSPLVHPRRHTVYDPWHYVPVLARKPGALRNGAPFKDWVLPAAMERVPRKLAGADDGNWQIGIAQDPGITARYTLIAVAQAQDADPQAQLADMLTRLADHSDKRIHVPAKHS